MLLDAEGSVTLIPRPTSDSETLPTPIPFSHPTYKNHNLILCFYISLLFFFCYPRCPWGFHIKIQYEYLTSWQPKLYCMTCSNISHLCINILTLWFRVLGMRHWGILSPLCPGCDIAETPGMAPPSRVTCNSKRRLNNPHCGGRATSDQAPISFCLE